MYNRIMGVLLLISQIILFSILFLFSNLFTLFTSIYLAFLFFLGIFLSIWGLISIGKSSYSPLPTLRKRNKFSKQGVYKYIRHPIYSGLMFIGLSFLLSRFVLPVTVVFILFIWVTIVKANLEEKLMQEKYLNYKEYLKQSRKFIPFLY